MRTTTSSREHPPGTELQYPGAELELFERAANWKRYWSGRVLPYIGRSVIEVGAGLGANIPLLCSNQESWLSIEPDRRLAHELAERIDRRQLPTCCRIFNGVLADVPANVLVDTVLYADVLEHIEHDHDEFRLAASHLDPGGHLIVLGPAHPSLFTSFDAAIGHYRRFDRGSYLRLAHPQLRLVRIEYLDSVGLLATLVNKLLLRTCMPSPAQIRVWDRLMVPVSVILDPLLARRVGKSILGVWRRV